MRLAAVPPTWPSAEMPGSQASKKRRSASSRPRPLTAAISRQPARASDQRLSSLTSKPVTMLSRTNIQPNQLPSAPASLRTTDSVTAAAT